MENSTNGTIPAEKKALLGAYNVKGTLGDTALLGAPIVHFNLVVVPSQNSISGSAEIIQAIAPPNGQLFIKNLKGQIHATGYGPVTQVVALEGDYTVGESYALIPFKAYMSINDQWEGSGSFTYGTQTIGSVPVHVGK
jgi:hypothetical protein